MSGQILTHAELGADVDWTCDVCIVGSGAGGAVLAAGLLEQGLDVVMLEEGSHLTRREFTLHESEAMPALYQERGTRATADQAITILQGRSVGGSTTINWTTCFRTPDRILSHWQRVWGLEGLTTAELAPHFDAVEARLGIQEWPNAMANPNNRVLYDGCHALGWEAAPLRRNVRGCANSGYCGLGCPVDGKQAMGVTYIDDAVKGGLRLLSNVRAERIETSGGRAVAVHGRVMTPRAGDPDGAAIRIRPKVVVSSAGAINGPALLLGSGLDAGGKVGRRTFLHPVIGSMGQFEETINPFWGAPQSMGSHQFIDRGADRIGFFLEAAPLQPMLAAVAFREFGAALHEGMSLLPHINALLALHVDGLLPEDDGGTVTLKGNGRPKVDYPIRPFLSEGFRHSHEVLARIQLAAGAQRVRTLHAPSLEFRTDADLSLLDTVTYGAHDCSIFTAHQMGGCTMGADPATSVVDPEHRFRGVDNLFVVDGSVLPTALGVNPSQTIYGLAHRARAFVAAAV
jgi:choline dehydrogenase-like flavoprotein